MLLKLLAKDASPAKRFFETLVPLLNHDNSKWRFAALRLVSEAQLPSAQKRYYASVLLNDPSEDVRRQAELVLSRFEK